MDFIGFPKITRFYEQDVVITEKIDGTNGVIHITPEGEMLAGSRTRWITTENDNYGFARWVEENKNELMKLGEGTHYGEWWGQGIQRKYNMTKKVFSLFNVNRWSEAEKRPDCCDVVPVLYSGPITPQLIDDFSTLKPLALSQAALNYGIEFDRPEGYMFWFSKALQYYKVPLQK